jgi:hypothetical protein
VSRTVVRTISVLAFIATAPLCLPLACIGYLGMTDTDPATNRSIFLTFMVFWLLPLLPAVLTYVPWAGLGKWLDRVEQWRDAQAKGWQEWLTGRLPRRKPPSRPREPGGQ